MAPYKLYQEPIQKYRELNTTDWTPTFTIQTNPTTTMHPSQYTTTISNGCQKLLMREKPLCLYYF